MVANGRLYLRDRAYGGPVVSGGKVFVATNNKTPRSPNINGDKGVHLEA
jgi:hypothetical protein